ncbi:S-adenosylmethionine-dependent methyltransferase [Aspergillus novofumigatus IBT 16806]|uniref:Methyltransferase n=1 Tax=Aspergillus novofumigatus (strain IBT 16806) TaxID=1392255 RepID=A0A2I1CLE0_ASPN1|nr:uncharacterized protein P174DRAFT_508705 [Aspergillus novofumigatus IBT 16806]PKX98433.1 hypothetical protein P174DRAFT_508705 [Aspergillus novofumigatus IBT 16806]
MLPTPSTEHVSFDTIYEPSEDSYLFLDTLSSVSESEWLSARFNSTSTSTNTTAPLVVEVGTGSGVVLAFVAANSHEIFGRRDILTLGTDVNRYACLSTRTTVKTAIQERQAAAALKSTHIASVLGDLCSPLRPGSVDVLLFNPPYVPTEELPRLPLVTEQEAAAAAEPLSRSAKFERDSYYLSLTGWKAESVGNSGTQAGWEKLVIVRIWRDDSQ